MKVFMVEENSRVRLQFFSLKHIPDNRWKTGSYKINHLRAEKWGRFATFTMLCSLHICETPKHFIIVTARLGPPTCPRQPICTFSSPILLFYAVLHHYFFKEAELKVKWSVMCKEKSIISYHSSWGKRMLRLKILKINVTSVCIYKY